MKTRGFLYRRLARFLPCVLPHVGEGSLSLHDKYDIASLRDVFLSAHYWCVFEHMKTPPKLVVDLGAHCGHFSVLCHLAIVEKFGSDQARYLLVEAQPGLIPRIKRVVDEAEISSQAQVVKGLVGKKSGRTGFATDARNLLSARALPSSNGQDADLPYVDLHSLVAPGTEIDLLKIDIEGSEFDLFDNYRDVFQAVKILLVEVHGQLEQQLSFARNLTLAGLHPLSATIVKEHERLLCYGPKGAPVAQAEEGS